MESYLGLVMALCLNAKEYSSLWDYSLVFLKILVIL